MVDVSKLASGGGRMRGARHTVGSLKLSSSTNSSHTRHHDMHETGPDEMCKLFARLQKRVVRAAVTGGRSSSLERTGQTSMVKLSYRECNCRASRTGRKNAKLREPRRCPGLCLTDNDTGVGSWRKRSSVSAATSSPQPKVHSAPALHLPVVPSSMVIDRPTNGRSHLFIIRELMETTVHARRLC